MTAGSTVRSLAWVSAVLVVTAFVLAPPGHDVAVTPRAEHVAVQLQSRETALPKAEATASDITTDVSNAIELGVSLFFLPVLFLISPVAVGFGFTCAISLDCGPNDPRRTFFTAYYRLVEPALRFLSPFIGLDWDEKSPSSTAADRPVAMKAPAGKATGASKRAPTKPGTVPVNAARAHHKPKTPAGLHKTTNASRAQAGSARRH